MASTATLSRSSAGQVLLPRQETKGYRQMIRFAHFRNFKQDGKVSERGGATVAYEMDNDNRVTRYAVARCSLLDNYDRRRGRELAGGRLNTPFMHYRINTKVEDFIRTMDTNIGESGFKRRQLAASA